MVSCIRNARGLIGSKRTARILVIRMALMHGAVIHAAHQSDGRGIFREIEFQDIHFFSPFFFLLYLF
jgi:hypothetical protein